MFLKNVALFMCKRLGSDAKRGSQIVLVPSLEQMRHLHLVKKWLIIYFVNGLFLFHALHNKSMQLTTVLEILFFPLVVSMFTILH